LLNFKPKNTISPTIILTLSLKKKKKLNLDTLKFWEVLLIQSLEKETLIEDVLPLSKNMLNPLKKEALLCNNGLKIILLVLEV
jgi:hypothetical protein